MTGLTCSKFECEVVDATIFFDVKFFASEDMCTQSPYPGYKSVPNENYCRAECTIIK